MKTKKLISCTVLIVVLCLLLSACGKDKVPNEEKCMADMNGYTSTYSSVNIDKLEIVRQQTNESEKVFSADVTFSGKDEYADYTGSATLIYNYYDDKGWMLDDIQYSDVQASCFAAQTKEEVDTYLKSHISEIIENCTKFEVTDCQLDGENSELVTMNWTTTKIKNSFLKKNHQGSIRFNFAEAQWQYYGVNSDDSSYEVSGVGGTWHRQDKKDGSEIQIVSATAEQLTLKVNGKTIDFSVRDIEEFDPNFESTISSSCDSVDYSYAVDPDTNRKYWYSISFYDQASVQPVFKKYYYDGGLVIYTQEGQD